MKTAEMLPQHYILQSDFGILRAVPLAVAVSAGEAARDLHVSDIDERHLVSGRFNGLSGNSLDIHAMFPFALGESCRMSMFISFPLHFTFIPSLWAADMNFVSLIVPFS